ncbi:hypothetical protein ACFL3S_01210 [Gemmatimonadota bacterium]
MATVPEEILQAASQRLDETGYFRTEDVRSLRTAVDALRGAGVAPDHPSQVFGPWKSLPEPARGALRRLAEEEISRVMSLHPRGRLWPLLARRARSASVGLEARGRYPRLTSWADQWSSRVVTAPSKLRERIDVMVHRASWARGDRVSAAGLLAMLGRRPRWLLGDYLTDVRVDPRARGFFHDRGRNVIWGYSVGIDLIPAPDGVWCVEANLNSGAFEFEKEEDWDLFDGDGAVERMLQAAKNQGVSTVWWHGVDGGNIHPKLLEALEEKARALGLDLILREDYLIPFAEGFPAGTSLPGKRLMSPQDPPENTLVIRRNDYYVGSDEILSNKEPFIRGIGAALEESGDQRFRVPAMTREPEILTPLSDDGLPNLVYKYPYFAWGHGVFFMRVRNADEAVAIARRLDRERGNPPGLFQPFVCSRLLPGRRVFDVRCEMLITPRGVSYITAFKRESNQPIPNELDEGLVSAKGVFTANTSTGGTSSLMDLDEGDEIRDAAMAVGEAVVRLLSRGFETER